MAPAGYTPAPVIREYRVSPMSSHVRPPPMAPVAIRAYTATTALGRGCEAQLNALRERRGGVRPNDPAALAPRHVTLDSSSRCGGGVGDPPPSPEHAHSECRTKPPP